jgi:L-threonylcarbamoyladenylate synthase
MKTEIIKIDPLCIEQGAIVTASEKIKSGGLVAFPTETVYGLGADALSPVACAKIFQAKNRPLEDPLIVHIADKQDLFKVAREIYKITLDLIDAFWPGPLTLVLRKSPDMSSIVTAGLETVAVRMPDHPVALSLIRESQTPIAAPSANLFGRPSPTTAQHVFDDLNGRVDFILDAGKTNIGVESTILDLTQTPFRILRPGGVSLESLRTIIPDIEPYEGNKILSPGMFKRHYSPKAKLILIDGIGKTQVDRVRELAADFHLQGYLFGIMAKEENLGKYKDFKVKNLGAGDNLTECAANLFSVLREFDREGVSVILAEGVKEEGVGVAIMDRLRRARGIKNE